MKSQPHPYDKQHLKQVLHRNELGDELKDLRDWAQNHLEIVLVSVLLVAALAFGVYFFLNSRKQRELSASLLLNQAQELLAEAVSGPPGQAAAAYGQAYLKYQSLVSTYPGGAQFRAAELGLADSDLGLGKADEAGAEYARLDDGKAGDPLSALGALGVARALEAKGKGADALAAYGHVLSAYPGGAAAAEASAARKRLAASPAVASAPPAPAPVSALPSAAGVPAPAPAPGAEKH